MQSGMHGSAMHPVALVEFTEFGLKLSKYREDATVTDWIWFVDPMDRCTNRVVAAIEMSN